MKENVIYLSITEQRTAMEQGKLTSVELTKVYLERIAKLDRGESGLNSVIEINPDALFIAEALDEDRRRGIVRGPLHGIPVMIKDNINTADKMHTTAGSLALGDNYAPYDAFIVKKLRAAGAVILGKTNMTEFANYMTEGMPSGYSSRGGQVVNPYVRGAEVGGSSSGSGTSVASKFCSAAVGTETSGSILSPSKENSIVGIKPTVGLISRYGIIPIAMSQDTAGPMAKTVEDAAILLGVLAGRDESDSATYKSIEKSFEDYTQFLDKNGLKGKRIGVAGGLFLEGVTEEMKEALKAISAAGAELVEDVELPCTDKLNSWNVLKYEFKVAMNSYLASLSHSTKIKTLKDIIEFNETHPEALKYGQKLLIDSENTSGTLTEPEYILERLEDLKQSQDFGIDYALSNYNLDALLFFGYNGCDVAARAGYPSIIIPAGYDKDGIPFGITFTAGAFSEPLLVSLGYAYEQLSKKRIEPELI